MDANMNVASDIVGHLIDGKKDSDSSTATSDIFDPANGTASRKVAQGGDLEVDAAVRAAQRAYATWSETPPSVRARVLFRYRDLLERHRDEIARLVTAEHGKTLADADGELTRGIEVVEFACGIPHLLKGEHSEQVGRGIDSWSLRQPLGVVAGVTPFNFPIMVPMWMFPIAIACGNAFVLKPSDRDPSSTLRIAEMFHDAGLPDGVLNVVQGGAPAVEAILRHSGVAAVSFVGSTPVARYIYTTAASEGKRVQALGGAKNHMVVLPDADIERTADALIGSAFGSAGERCMAISVAVAVGDKVADALVDKLVPKMQRIAIGPGAREGTDMGPLITREHLDRVREYVDSGEREGAMLVVDGRGCKVPGHEEGFYLGPCLFDRVTAHMRVYQEEIFGPVLCIVRVPTFEAAIDIVNRHAFGNGTAIFTRDGGQARSFVHRIKVGMVGVNVPIPVPMAFHSFGGWKRSIFGDVAVHGVEGVRFYTQLKTITSRWPTEERPTAEYAMPTMQ